MDDRISKLYTTLNISPQEYPNYKNPYDFAKTLKKCSLNTDVYISTSSNTIIDNNNNSK